MTYTSTSTSTSASKMLSTTLVAVLDSFSEDSASVSSRWIPSSSGAPLATASVEVDGARGGSTQSVAVTQSLTGSTVGVVILMLLILIVGAICLLAVQRQRRSLDLVYDGDVGLVVERPDMRNPLYHDEDANLVSDYLARVGGRTPFQHARGSMASLQWDLQGSDAAFEPNNTAFPYKAAGRKHHEHIIDRNAEMKMTDVGPTPSPSASPAYELYEGDSSRRASSATSTAMRASGGGGRWHRPRPLVLDTAPLHGDNRQLSPPPSYANSNPSSPLNPAAKASVVTGASDGAANLRGSSQLSDIYTADRGHVRLGYLTLVGEDEDELAYDETTDVVNLRNFSIADSNDWSEDTC